ncbi:MAG: hypothetical protein J6N76_09400 [Lachnospiraceae bacterium]|nr:hypothetical protein [Lachnospiraceae bacterium]
MHYLRDEESIAYLKELLYTKGLQVIMLTRGIVPGFLSGEEINLSFIRIQEGDFCFGEREVETFFKDKGIAASREDIQSVTIASQGYARAVYGYIRRMENGEHYSERMQEEVWEEVFNFWDGTVYDLWTNEFKTLALSVCYFDEFTEEMAAYLSGLDQVGKVIDHCLNTMSQLRRDGEGRYYFRREIKRFFIWKRSRIWTESEKRSNCRKAADYYEMKGDIPRALKYYKEAEDIERVKELLIKNMAVHHGVGHYVDAREYYFGLSREDILESPTLMAGMSMLCSLLLKTEESEEWYRALTSYYKDKKNPRELRREAKCRIAYLDIGLPHRGVVGILKIIRREFTLMERGDITLPEFNVTGNMPSVMNGGMDFSDWSKSDVQIAKYMGKPVEAILGRHGKGLVNIALAESGFEKGTIDAYEVLTLCGNGYGAASAEGSTEMCFVAVGIQVRCHILEGQLPMAKRVIESFRKKVLLENAKQLLPNLDALELRAELYSGSVNRAEEYIDSVSDAKVFFYVMDRYRQATKLRCLIEEDRLEEAYDLAVFLSEYYIKYERHLYDMENEVLKSIILYRLRNPHYKEHIIEALKKTEEYHFVRIISMEGAAILPILKEMKENGEFEGMDEGFIKQVFEETLRVSTIYPNYMKKAQKEEIALSKREAQVLSLLCAGMTTGEICEELGISYDGLKKHNKNIYRKLGAKDRAEAERKAVQMGLVYL